VQRILVAVTALVLSGATVQAQSEAALKEYFEGRTVALKLPMPGTEKGVDIYPGNQRPLDYPRYADRLKDYGTAIRSGESVVVTKIKVKSKHIEFQLGGGGYGTMGDETSSNVGTGDAPKTKREQNLEAELKRESDPAKKRAMKEELDDLKSARERENARNRSAVAEAEEHRKQNIRQRRVEGGSRFNIRFNEDVRSDALRPEAVMAALSQYVDFGQLADGNDAATAGRIPPTNSGFSSRGGPGSSGVSSEAADRPAGMLHKGMLIQEADALYGEPVKKTERKEGSLTVQTREYAPRDGRTTAEFVEGVLIRYSISSD
jgi:hypothetical protein